MSRATKNPRGSGPAPSRVLIPKKLTRAQQIARAIGCADSPAMRSLLDHAAPRFGRPRKVPLRSIAILLALHAIRTGSSMIISRIVSTADDLTPSERHTIGIPKGVALNDKRIRSGVTALIGRSAAGLQIPHDHPEADPVTGEVIYCGPGCPHVDIGLDEILTDIVLASLPTEYLSSLPTVIAVDGTDIESHYRSRRPGPTTPDGQKWDCIDTEVALGKRTPTDRRRNEFYLGYEAHIATIVPTGTDQEIPLLAVGLALRPGVRDRCPAALAIIRRIGTVTEVLADRAYTTAKPEHWARPLRTMGITDTKDLHETQRGVRPGPVPDTIWLDCRLHSAANASDLRELDPPRPADTATTKARRREEFDRRRKYEFVAHKEPDPVTGAQRFKGPALAGRVRFRNVPKRHAQRPVDPPAHRLQYGHAVRMRGHRHRARHHPGTRPATAALAKHRLGEVLEPAQPHRRTQRPRPLPRRQPQPRLHPLPRTCGHRATHRLRAAGHERPPPAQVAHHPRARRPLAAGPRRATRR